MEFGKKGHAALLIAAVVSVVALAGLLMVNTSSMSGASTVSGVSDSAYANIGVRTDAELWGWEVGQELATSGKFEGSEWNRACGQECAVQCGAQYGRHQDAEDCGKFCVKSCEQALYDAYGFGRY